MTAAPAPLLFRNANVIDGTTPEVRERHDVLVEAGLVYEGAKAFATPRRLALAVHGVPVKQPDLKEEKKGPRVGAPEQAIAGFLKSAGLSSLDQAKIAQ